MRPFHHREPGVLGAALDVDGVTCEVICDGVHVDPAAVRLLARSKGPARIALITDAIEATGLPDGDYRLGVRPISVVGGRATLPESETIAGSTLTMGRALRNAVEPCAVTVEDAARMASTTPAELLGIADRKGLLAAGRDADVAILDPDRDRAGCADGGAARRSPAVTGAARRARVMGPARPPLRADTVAVPRRPLRVRGDADAYEIVTLLVG